MDGGGGTNVFGPKAAVAGGGHGIADVKLIPKIGGFNGGGGTPAVACTKPSGFGPSIRLARLGFIRGASDEIFWPCLSSIA